MGTGTHNTAGFNGGLGKRVNAPYSGQDIDQAFQDTYLKGANPNRNKFLLFKLTDRNEYLRLKREWRENCQRAAFVTDLRLAGYDVEAQPKSKGGIDAGFFQDFSNLDENSFYNIYSNSNWRTFDKLSEADLTKAITGILSKSGDRAVVGNLWKSGGAHATNLVNAGGKIYRVDGQTNKVEPLSDYLQHVDTLKFNLLYTGNSASSPYKLNPKLSKFVIKKARSKK